MPQRQASATGYAAAFGAGSGESLGQPGGRFWLNEPDTGRVGVTGSSVRLHLFLRQRGRGVRGPGIR